MWRFNYILPFVKKYQFDEGGKSSVVKHILKTYMEIKPIHGKGKRTVGLDTKELLSRVDISFDVNSRFVYFIDTKKTIAVPGNILSNFTLDYDKIVHGSFMDLATKAQGTDEYGMEAKLVIDGINILVKRIIDAIPLSQLSEELKEKHTEYFERILFAKAEHFEEALQRILFFNQIMWQTRHRLNGLGRLDKMLADLYQKDIDTDILTEEKACELVYDFLNQLSKYASYKSDALEGDIGQIIILGGNQPNGKYFCTEIFLKEQANLKKPDPKTFLRVGKNMPDSLLKLAVSCLTAKTGSPLFSNDEVVIPVLKGFGMPNEDAYSYCVSACWEPYIVGKSLDQNNIMVFDYFKALDAVLNNGVEYRSIEELVESYIKETYLIAQTAGEVSEIFPKVGELVGTGAPIMNIAILDDMWVTFNVREDLLQGLTMGTEFEAFVPALDKNIRLKVNYMKDLGTYAAWKATKTTGQFDLKTFEVKALPQEKVEGLRPGMSVILKK